MKKKEMGEDEAARHKRPAKGSGWRMKTILRMPCFKGESFSQRAKTSLVAHRCAFSMYQQARGPTAEANSINTESFWYVKFPEDVAKMAKSGVKVQSWGASQKRG